MKLSFLALVVLALPLAAQGGKTYRRYAGPLRSMSLDLATGTLTRAPQAQPRTAATIADFYNNDLGGFVGADTGNGFCEWIDAAVKGFAGNQSDLMSEIVFAYCSSMRDPSSGGPGGSVRLGFYEGYVTFGSVPTTPVAVFTLTGLPGNTASSSFFGGFRCFFMHVAFADLVAFADGPIGYSWRFIDVGTDGIVAGTWPFLACVASCSGVYLQLDGQGMEDVFDEYCPPGNLRYSPCWGFCTTSGTFRSISMEVREVADQAATALAYNAASTPNPDLLSAGPARIGGTWSASLTRAVPSAPGSFVVALRTNRVALANGVQGPPPLPLGAGGRILISGPLLSSLGGAHDGTTGALSASVPAALALTCVHFAAQATVLGGGVRLSSAVEGTTGTF